MEITKRMLSLTLALVMLLSCVPLQGLAQEMDTASEEAVAAAPEETSAAVQTDASMETAAPAETAAEEITFVSNEINDEAAMAATSLVENLFVDNYYVVQDGTLVQTSGTRWSYDYTTNTITLRSGASISYDIVAEGGGLNLVVNGDASISGSYGIYTNKDLNITVSDGATLTITCPSGQGCIYSDGDVRISGSGTVTMQSAGVDGIWTNGDLYVDGAVLNIDAEGTPIIANNLFVGGMNRTIINLTGGDNQINRGNVTLTGDTHVYSEGILCGTVDGAQINQDCHYITQDHMTYTANGDGTHTANCADTCSFAASFSRDCYGGTANCTEPQICAACGGEYGELGTHSYGSDGFCTACDAYEPAVDSDSDGYYEIGNAGQLFWFAAVVNEGYGDVTQNVSANAVMTADITIPADMAWTPAVGYRGSFDGKGYAVSNLNCSVSGNAGLFGSAELGAKICNVTLRDSSISGSNAGGVVGSLYGGSTSNTAYCTVSGCTVIDTTVTGSSCAGGIVGYSNNYGTVEDCKAENISVDGSNYAGGIVGEVYNGGTIIGCEAEGSVTGKYAGGILGYTGNNAGVYSGRTATVSRCSANGSIGDAGTRMAGGIVGQVSVETSLVITNCRSGGTVTSATSAPAETYEDPAAAGGILGSTVEDYSSSSATIKNCYSLAATQGYKNGNIAGNVYNAAITNCYYEASAESDSFSGTVCKTADQFASGEVAYLLNGDQSSIVWYQTLETDDYPAFQGDTVYYGYINCGNLGYANEVLDAEAPRYAYHGKRHLYCLRCHRRRVRPRCPVVL